MLVWTNGRKVYFDIVGRADAPVVYFAHSLAADSSMWSEQIPDFLAAGYRVLRVDMRGHGGSDPAPGNFTMEQLVEDAVQILDHLSIAKAHFCGLSIGGMIAQGLGILHSDRIASLILCDTQSEAPKDAKERWGPRVIAIQAANSMKPIAEATMGRWLSAEFKKKIQAYERRFTTRSLQRRHRAISVALLRFRISDGHTASRKFPRRRWSCAALMIPAPIRRKTA